MPLSKQIRQVLARADPAAGSTINEYKTSLQLAGSHLGIHLAAIHLLIIMHCCLMYHESMKLSGVPVPVWPPGFCCVVYCTKQRYHTRTEKNNDRHVRFLGLAWLPSHLQVHPETSLKASLQLLSFVGPGSQLKAWPPCKNSRKHARNFRTIDQLMCYIVAKILCPLGNRGPPTHTHTHTRPSRAGSWFKVPPHVLCRSPSPWPAGSSEESECRGLDEGPFPQVSHSKDSGHFTGHKGTA